MADSMHHLDHTPGAPHGPVVSEVEAKQGRRGSQILVVLLTSLALVVIAFGALYLYSARPFSAAPVAPPKTPSPVSTP